MDFQQIVLIVLGILYFIFRSSGKEEKSGKKQPKPSSGETTPSLEDIIRELTGQAQAPKPAAKPVVVEETRSEHRTKVKHQALDTSEHEAYRKQVHANSRIKKAPRVSSIPDKVVLIDDHEFEFDLRQAIINDAILNRPHQ